MYPLCFSFVVETWTLSTLFPGDPTLVWLCLDHQSITCTGAGRALGHGDKEEGQGYLKSSCREAHGADFTWSLPSPCVCLVRGQSSEKTDGLYVWIGDETRRKTFSAQEKKKVMRKTGDYLPNFLNPIEARSYFKSQYSLCFLTYLSLKWALAWVL